MKEYKKRDKFIEDIQKTSLSKDQNFYSYLICLSEALQQHNGVFEVCLTFDKLQLYCFHWR
jgi:hypothetical protein